MQTKVSRIFELFEKNLKEAKSLFLELSKQIKSKKAALLYEKLEYLEIFGELLGKIHFDKEEFANQLFRDFRILQKDLKKIIRLKTVENGLRDRQIVKNQTYRSYEAFLADHKKGLHTEAFDRIVGGTISKWERLNEEVKNGSNGHKPITISTAIHQLVNEELEFFHVDWKKGLDAKACKDMDAGLRKILHLEFILQYLGFNPIFVTTIHEEMEGLLQALSKWYNNHLELQSLSQYLSDKEQVSKKYLDWIKELQVKKKSLSSNVEKQAQELFQKILD
ncbi:hypothetical protein E4S40_10485 [Algoriphagus kandeliae]|uniref:CHAD domain-containing protein n=1 Tax=Algoriphagus kandeliae TaxID=2562278 RepID=A0A4Y9QS36_9BACT|nr:hypothetical protein [Algoriphagus kandeliae]TFV94442.1 hypothetical protein E4S40_10485 [Algoriphagus kandeliae]